MEVIFISIIAFLVIFAGMTIGVIISGKEIKGSCGGIAAIFGDSAPCDICELKDRCDKNGKKFKRT